MVDTRFGALCRDIYAYYRSPVVPNEGHKQDVMLRATGEPWTKEELEGLAYYAFEASYDEFRHLATQKHLQGIRNRTANGSLQALVDDYGNVINLSVSECKEIVDSFKALVRLRMVCDGNAHGTTIPAEYFRHILSSTGDCIDGRHMDILMSLLPGVNQNVSLRSLLKLLSRKE